MIFKNGKVIILGEEMGGNWGFRLMEVGKWNYIPTAVWDPKNRKVQLQITPSVQRTSRNMRINYAEAGANFSSISFFTLLIS